MSACASTSDSQTSAPTLSSTVASTAAPIASNTVSPTAAPTSVAETSPTSEGTANRASSSSDPVTLVIDTSSSQASYHAHEQLVGRTLPSEAVGTSKAVSGSIVLGPDGSIVPDQSQISVDLSKLTSDESRRDTFIKSSTLQTSRYPTATFVPRQAQGLPTPLPTSGQLTFQLAGDLTVHGATKPVTWQVAAQFDGANVSGDATTSVNITDFGMSPPKAGPVLSIEDGLTLELAFSADYPAAARDGTD